MKIEVVDIKGGYIAYAESTETTWGSTTNYNFSGVGTTIAKAIDDALLETERFKSKLKLLEKNNGKN